MPPGETLAAARRIVVDMGRLQAECWQNQIRPALAREGIEIVGYTDLRPAEKAAADEWFRTDVFPVLTPLAVDQGHRFPFISNLSENLGVLLENPEMSSDRLFARVKIPGVLPQFVRLDSLDTGGVAPAQPEPDGPGARTPIRFIPLDDLILHNLDDLFPGMTIVDVLPFRITRNAALEIEDDDADDLLEQVEEELRLRRFASPLRIQVGPNPSRTILRIVTEELGLSDMDIYERPGPLAYADLFQIASLDRPDLKEPVWRPAPPPRLADESKSIFEVIRERDLLVHHPYESFELSVERFVAEAASDPDVLAIKQTLYRTSRDSPFIDSLIAAATNGKQVACLVELRARFDEEKNVRFARQLEKAGVHVAYGVVGLKTHCKCSLVVRREADEQGKQTLRTYCHIGTGNYHPGTAQLYTDLGLMTADPAIGQDVAKLFNALTGHAATHDYDRLLVAPATLRPAFERLIDREIACARAGRPARIVAKMNALEDRAMTERLYAASQAGVDIDLIVRGFCCLRPGVPGLSERIRVRSIIGRFLEHSRIYAFANGQTDPAAYDYFFGSADWMYRNLNDRVEAVVPVLDSAARHRLAHAVDTMLRDRRSAWQLRADGSYEQLQPPAGARPDAPENLGTFVALMHAAGSRGDAH
jgi:polyphosphate kinase